MYQPIGRGDQNNSSFALHIFQFLCLAVRIAYEMDGQVQLVTQTTTFEVDLNENICVTLRLSGFVVHPFPNLLDEFSGRSKDERFDSRFLSIAEIAHLAYDREQKGQCLAASGGSACHYFAVLITTSRVTLVRYLVIVLS